MARLPQPGSDDGTWGDILNDFLGEAHNADGSIKDTGVVAEKYTLPDGGIPASDLSDAVQNTLNEVPDKYTLPDDGIPESDLHTDVQTKLNDSLSGALDTDPTLADDSDAKVASQKATKAYVDALEEVTVPERPGAIIMRDPNLTDWFADLAIATTVPVDLIVIGDSISEFGWVNNLEKQLATRYNARASVTTSPTVGILWADATASSLGGRMTTVGGTANAGTLAGWGTTLTNGQSASTTTSCDGVIVIWTAGTGSLIVKDGGSGGTTVATIDTSTGSGANNLTSIDLTSYASHNIYIESSGNTVLEGIYPTVGNRTVGVRVWRVGHSGYKTADHFNADPNKGTNFVAKLKAFTGRDPHVLVATGFNDPLATYSAQMNTLIDTIQGHTNGSIALWIPWGNAANNGNGAGKAALAHTLAEQQGLAVIDAFQAFGDISDFSDSNDLSGDAAHPNNNGTSAITMQALMALSGDPLGSLTSMVAQGSFDIDGLISYSSGGRFHFTQFFGLPYFQLYGIAADTGAQITFAPASISSGLLGGPNSASIMLGAGGSTSPDVVIARESAGVATIRTLSASTYANITTLLMRFGTSSPEASVSAPIGANYKETTTGTLYIKTVGTGNTGWAPAAGPEVINTQTGTTYTFVLADQGKTVEMNNAGAMTLTVPPNSSVAFPTGTRIKVVRYGAGTLTLAPGSGVTIRSRSGLLSVNGQYGAVTLYKRGTNEWVLSGDLV